MIEPQATRISKGPHSRARTSLTGSVRYGWSNVLAVIYYYLSALKAKRHALQLP